MDRGHLNRLNNIEYNNNNIFDIKQYIKFDILPKDLNDRQIKRFKEKFKNFIIHNNKLFYQNKNEDENDNMLEVVNKNDIQDVLKKCYEDPVMSAGNGIYKFYSKICKKYVGIKLKDVKLFLPNQQFYQLAKHDSHHINKPILVDRPNERWAIDLVDMNKYKSHNNIYRYILTCIDYFSKYCWARPLVHKKSTDVRDALQSIVEDAGVKPDIIQKDNGREFQKRVNTWMKENKIQFINTLSYTPQSNGLVENLNKNLRTIFRELAIRNRSLRWIDYLQIAVENKNTQKNSTTKFTPYELWTENKEIDPENKMQKLVSDRIKAKAKATLEK